MGITTVRRRDYLRALLEHARTDQDGIAPWRAVAATYGDLERHFSDEAELLVELHREWLRALVTRLHQGEVVAQRSAGNVRDLYDEVCAANPTLRRILDTYRAHPALWEPTAGEHAMLARIAGLPHDRASLDEAADLGRALVSARVPMQRGALASA